MLSTNAQLSALGIHSTPTFFLNNKRVTIGPEGLEKTLEKLIQ
jgi:protein-disulfide isomerase